ncbi:ankyrin repeat domain-containing protein [Paenibacillus provencensis]|uniref:Ankyrin repeat domain-containing protein n=1 Tax=Paenibacillus provencensis TaxID=441151 RepID=A0ABW3PV26_9BACL|nr:ankyrin repeat domain-containing protein [Paenibacillus sp. MER 78]MCM3128066.1 ankyrin repeat domain-containing protein [Paenibacillus sp. MER 78]
MEMVNLKISDLFKALIAGDTAKVLGLLEEQPHLANTENEDGLTPLAYAGHLGFTEIVQALLEYEVEVNAVTHSQISYIPSNTALHATIAGERSLEIIRLLLARGADPRIVDSNGHTPLHSAAYHADSLEMIQLLLEHGAEWDKLTPEGETALQIADGQGNQRVAEMLRQIISKQQ